MIHEVRFEERMTPTELRVQLGDEIRWVNQRSTPVTVEFLGDALNDVTCQSGFSNLLRRQQETATIRPDESASLCFGRVGTVTYNARMESPVAGGQMIESGMIHIGQ
jgi:plastocyanin